MSKQNIQHIHALTPMQEGMLFHALHDRAANPYFEQCHFRLRGRLDRTLFEVAWNAVVQRHDILRTRFVFKNIPQPRQVVLRAWQAAVVFQDLRAHPGGEQRALIDRYKAEDWQQGFDLGRAVPMRMALFCLADDLFEVLHSFHHILLDGWSVGIIHEELFRLYTALAAGETPRLPRPIPFGDYIRWLEQRDRQAAAAYWRRELAGYRPAVALPGCRVDPQVSFQAEEHAYTLPDALSTGLRHLAARLRVTQNTLIQAAWGILLARVNRVTDVVFLATVSGRPPEIAGVERMVGLFINAVPVRVRAVPDIPFDRLVQQMQSAANAASEHHHHPLADIQAESGLAQQQPDHILVFENYAAADISRFATPDANAATLRVEAYKQVDHSNYPLTVQIIPGERLGFNLIRHQAALASATVDALVAGVAAILTQVTDDPTTRIGEIALPAALAAIPVVASQPAVLPPTAAAGDPRPIELVVAATFTADPILPHLRWWGAAFGLTIDVQFAGYNQV
ncbi:MAG: hypothetical protein HQL66_07150, partial [Magnetococcales bacterium]|nr:hypothetical protein [Magnetococcales bacterium]